ncbi:MAG: hypothetical protein V4599_11265 [Verrucomicrobiota bacterium]
MSELYLDCHDAEIIGLSWDVASLHLKLLDYEGIRKTFVLNGLMSLRIQNLIQYNIIGDNELLPPAVASEAFWKFLLADSPTTDLFNKERTRLLEVMKDGGLAVFFEGCCGATLAALCSEVEWRDA